MFKKFWVLILPALFFLSSCNSSGCYEKMEVNVNCTFLLQDSAKAVSIDSVSVWGVGSDSLVYSNEKVSELALQLKPNADETKYVFKAVGGGQEFTDTITFKYERQPWFQSMDCGCMVFSTIDTCLTTGSIFKSATIVERKVDNKGNKNVILNI